MLPNGITGFRDLNAPYIQEQEKKVFREFCYSIAARYHCVVTSFDIELVGKNFYSAEIRTYEGFLLENAYYPYIAFAKNLDVARIEFTESPFCLTGQNVHVFTLSELAWFCQSAW